MANKTLKSVLSDVEVTAFVDYRDYLGELYRRMREQHDQAYSYESFASDLGFSATNVLRLVVTRKRALATNSALTIVNALGLKHGSRKYFLAMVRHVNARSPRLREQFFRKMLEAKQASIVSHRDKDRLAFLADWYHWVVLEMLRMKDAKADPEWLADHMSLPVPAEKIRRSLALLQSIELVAPGQEPGTLRVVEDSPTLVPSDDSSARLAMMQHHQSMIENAKQALAKLPSDQVEYNALTMSLSLASFQEMQEKSRRFCEDMMAIEARDQVRDCVVQFNLNLFSLTKRKKGRV